MNRWERAQISERRKHTFEFQEGYLHYLRSYVTYFSYLQIDLNIKGNKIAEIGPADYPGLSYCFNTQNCVAIEPMPSIILSTSGINVVRCKAEDFDFSDYDEVWIMNVLQHVEDPGKIVEKAKQAKCVKFFEPINFGTDECHLHNLTMEMFKDWFGDVKYYPKNENAVAFHTWECAYGIWLRLDN